jgi:hypothetical protein
LTKTIDEMESGLPDGTYNLIPKIPILGGP